MRRGSGLALAAALAAAAGACGGPGESSEEIEARLQARIERVLDRNLDRIAVLADSIDDALRPVPLLTGAEEAALREYLNREQLARARRLGERPEDAAEMAALQRAGQLVELEDSTEYWVVRELDHSVALVTPDTRALLTELGRRFQERLDSLDLPPFRLEVTSVLRTAETQAELRGVNPNAAAGVSTHEFGTTLDVAYNSFAAPADPVVEVDAEDAPWLASRIERVAGAVAETVAARRSRELQAILGRVLRELQREGKVMVTLERQQPVYHMTVAKRLVER